MKLLLSLLLLASMNVSGQKFTTAITEDSVTIETASKRVRNGVYDIYVRIKTLDKSCVYGKPPLLNNAWLHHTQTRMFMEGVEELSDSRVVAGKKTQIRKHVPGTEQKRVIKKVSDSKLINWVHGATKASWTYLDTSYISVPTMYLWGDNCYYGGMTIRKRIRVQKGATYLPIGVEYQVDKRSAVTKYVTLNLATTEQ